MRVSRLSISTMTTATSARISRSFRTRSADSAVRLRNSTMVHDSDSMTAPHCVCAYKVTVRKAHYKRKLTSLALFETWRVGFRGCCIERPETVFGVQPEFADGRFCRRGNGHVDKLGGQDCPLVFLGHLVDSTVARSVICDKVIGQRYYRCACEGGSSNGTSNLSKHGTLLSGCYVLILPER